MIPPSTEQRIVAQCRELCKSFGLDQMYLAEVVGPRRHYLAGYGRPSLNRPEQLQLSAKVALLWHGAMTPAMQNACKDHLQPLIERLEHELSSM